MRVKKSCLSTYNQHGFTLVELLMVIAILGVIASIAIKTVQEEKSKSYDTQAIAFMRNLLTRAETDPPDDITAAANYGGAGMTLLGETAPPDYPQLILNTGMRLWIVYDAAANGDNRLDFFLAHAGGKLGYYFWIPVESTTANIGLDGLIPADKLVPSFDTRNLYPIANYRNRVGY